MTVDTYESLNSLLTHLKSPCISVIFSTKVLCICSPGPQWTHFIAIRLLTVLDAISIPEIVSKNGYYLDASALTILCNMMHFASPGEALSNNK